MKISVSESENIPIDELLTNLQEKIENDLIDVNKQISFIPEIHNKCIALTVTKLLM